MTVHKNEVYYADLSPVIGSEQGGTRPVLVIQNDTGNKASPTIIIAATTSISNAIMTESSLSFLGIGIQEPLSSWGKLLQSAQSNLQNAVYMAIIPGLLIMLTIFAFNKLGNLLRIYVDPRVMDAGK